MKELFEHILNNYIVESNKKFKDNEMADFLRNEVEKQIIDGTKINKDKYKVQGSPGKGQWTNTPWIALFNNDVTNTATKGLYVVYLFCEDMSGFYLSLNQGYTFFKNQFGAGEGKSILNFMSKIFRNKIVSDISNFSSFEIDLKSNTDSSAGYERGNICSKKYLADSIPKKEVLINDLHEMIGIYQELIDLIEKDYNTYVNKYLEFNSESIDIEEDFDYLEIVHQDPQPKEDREDKPEKKEESSTYKTNRAKRDSQKARNALEEGKYLCEYDSEHKYFISKTINKNYTEAHHLIPLSNQDDFKYSLDVESNILSLYPVCHSKLHHAKKSTKKEILESLYEKRKKRLKKCNIWVSFEGLFKYYK